MKLHKRVAISSTLLMSAIQLAYADQNPAPDTIFFGGPIVTMDQKIPSAQAVAIKDGRIQAVGNLNSLKKNANETTRLVNLNGKTLMPGFVEPHVHIIGTAFSEGIFYDISNFTLPHDTIDGLVKKLSDYAATVKDGDWILAFGVDPSRTEPFMSELTADVLDKVSTTKPIFVLNQSMHIAYVNHKAMEIAGVTDATPSPQGGTLVKGPDGKLTGVIYEAPTFYMFLNKMPEPTLQEIQQALIKTGKKMVSKGVTTSAEITVGAYLGVDKEYALLNAMTHGGQLPFRVRGYMYASAYAQDNKKYQPNQGDDIFKVIGVKIVSDGSNQGLTGAMLEPYTYPAGTKNKGSLNYSEQQLYDLAKPRFDEGWQISIHSNGDQAIDQTLNVFEKLVTKPEDRKSRFRIEHFTVPTNSQIDRAAKLGVVPGFTIGHTDYWGEAFHDHLIGPERADRIGSSATMIKKGMHFAYHSDSPITPIQPLNYVSEGASRLWQAKPQKVLNPAQKVSIHNALKAVTIDAAYQMKMENDAGSIAKGKYADLVILDKNPLTTDAYEIRNIKVQETWVNGKKVYSAD